MEWRIAATQLFCMSTRLLASLGKVLSPRTVSNLKPERLFYTELQISYVALCSGWPSMGLRFAEGTNVTKVLEHLSQHTFDYPDQFDVFTTDSFSTDPATSLVDLKSFKHGKFGAGLQSMPERYHFSANYRIAPVWIVPRIGYALTYHGDTGSMPTGVRFPRLISRYLIPVVIHQANSLLLA
jgi:hypothetical protein